MLSFSQTHIARFGVALLAVSVALLVTLWIEPLARDNPLVLFFGSVAIAAWFGGRSPGILSIFLSVIGVDFFLFQPTYEFKLGAYATVEFCAFAAVALFIVWLTTIVRQNKLALGESESRYGFLFDGNPNAVLIVDPQTSRLLAVNKAACNTYGYTQSEFLSLNFSDFSGNEMRFPRVPDSSTEQETGPITVSKHTRKDGSVLFVELASHKLTIDKRLAHFIISRDVTDRIRTSETLKASVSRLRAVFGSCPVSMCVSRWSDDVIIEANAEFFALTGSSVDEAIGRTASECGILTPQTASELRSLLSDHGTVVDKELEIKTRSGKIRTILFGAVFVEILGDKHIIATFLDVTELRRAEIRHRESEERLRIVTNKAQIGLVMIDSSRRFTYVNTTYADLFDLPPANFVGRRIESVHSQLYSKQIGPSLDRAFAGKNFCYELRRPTIGGDRYYDVRYEPSEVNGEITSLVAVVNEITDRTRAELAGEASEERYRTLFEYAPDGIAISNCDSVYLDANETLCRMLGYSGSELIGLRTSDIVIPKEIPHLGETLIGLNADLEYYQEWQFKRKDQSTFPGEVISTIMPDGNTLTVIRDITERKRLEDQLLQAQKMEAIGVLAGGVAHDFNNILTAISGYSDLTLRHMSVDDPLRDYVVEISEAGIRAAALTSQLLAFSRRRVLTPIVHNLNTAVTDTERMLRRIVKENIEFQIDLEPNLGNINADPGQISQVIVNLAVNAGDAMSNGGILTIATRNIYLDGPFVELTVSDTGTGMDAQTQRRLFEPFYTTKEVGKGTGLGLSTVFGIVKQSGGEISVSSDLVNGTTFKVYLPCVAETIEDQPTASQNMTIGGGTETILLVEDEVAVRNLVKNVLTGSGYLVLAFGCGEEAMTICRTYPDKIHLLLTDIIMPRINGSELRDAVVTIRPHIKSLFMSGYTGDAINKDAESDANTALIEKPFSPDELICKVREVLESTVDFAELPKYSPPTTDVAKAASGR